MPVTILEDIVVERAMAIFAHPDDAEFGNAGLAADWTDQGVEFTYVLVTNGGSGSSDPAMTRERLTEIRITEQQNACDILGVQRLVALGFEDGYLEVDLDLRRAIAREVRRHKPDVIIAPDPTMRHVLGRYINHPDHIAVGEVVCRAINPDASTRLMFPELWEQEGLEPHLPKAVLFQGFVEGEFLWDISKTLDRKLEALACHLSQHDDQEGTAEMVRTWATELGKKLGVEAAEPYLALRTG